MSVLGVIGLVVGLLVVALVLIGVAFLVGMRRKTPWVLRTVRRFNRALVNPRALRTAGRPGAYASVIEHVGRISGRVYRTPVVAEPTDDGFVIALPYGTSSNWVKNVLAAGAATVTDEGATYRLERPELLPLAEMIDHFPPGDRRSFARFRVEQCLRLRAAAYGEVAAGAAGRREGA